MLRRLALGLMVTAVACGGGATVKKTVQAPTATVRSAPAGGLTLSSTAFSDGAPIPKQYTCDGAGQSPPLAWRGVPTGTESVALRVQDIDTAQKFIHWIVYGISPSTTSLSAGQVPAGAKQAANSFGKQGYGGPCPPAGSTHRYVFTLLALGTQLNVSDNVSPSDLWATLERSDVVGRGELTGTYQRAGS